MRPLPIYPAQFHQEDLIVVTNSPISPIATCPSLSMITDFTDFTELMMFFLLQIYPPEAPARIIRTFVAASPSSLLAPPKRRWSNIWPRTKKRRTWARKKIPCQIGAFFCNRPVWCPPPPRKKSRTVVSHAPLYFSYLALPGRQQHVCTP